MYKRFLALAIACSAPLSMADSQTAGNIGYAQVIDSNSKVVGPLVETVGQGGTGAALVKVGQYFVGIPVSPGGFENIPYYQIFYSAAGCKGDRYLQPSLPISGILLTNGQLLFSKPPFAGVSVASVLSNTGGGARCSSASGTVYAGPVAQTSVNALGFTAPFSGRLAPQ